MARQKSNPLPPPTKSEAAFERALRSLDGGAPEEIAAFVARVYAEREKYLERDPFGSIGGAETFHTKIVGVSFEGRQDVVAGLEVGNELDIVRQPDNPKDPNAIAVRYGALHLGFLRAAIAKHLAPLIDDGLYYRARVASLTGGTATKHRGVNIFVWRTAIGLSSGTSPSEEDERIGITGDRTIDARRVQEALIGNYQPHRAQLAILERLEAGKNTLGVLGTGRGKSFCFQYTAALRALTHEEKTLIVYPLRALANDQHDGMLRKLDPFGLRIHRANGSISPEQREDLFSALRNGAWDIILATPEFLEFHRDAFTGKSIPGLVVVDEAHHLYESKHRAAYGKLGKTIASLGVPPGSRRPNPQVLALTATAGDEAFKHIVEELTIEAWVIDPTVRENLHVVDARQAGGARGKNETKSKIAYLEKLFEDDDGKGIIYCMSRTEAQKIADALRKKFGDVVMFYHAGMPTPERLEVERYFREGALRIVVATSAFGEGIDLPDVRHVVLYHLNFDFTEFNQQAGRAGRDGQTATIHLLFGEEDKRINTFIIDREAPTLPVLRELYRGMRGLTATEPNGSRTLRMPLVEIARTLDLDKANERTVAAALRIFEEAGLTELGFDDEGRFARFLPVDGKVDLERNERYAEGESERENFARFAALALTARAEALERIINRPIYPERVKEIV